MYFVLISFYWQGDPGEDGAPGKPGTAVVSHYVTCHAPAVTCRILNCQNSPCLVNYISVFLSLGRTEGSGQSWCPGV